MKLRPAVLGSALVPALVLLGASTAQAVTLTTDVAAFEAATVGLSLSIETFDDVGPIDVHTIGLRGFALGSTNLLDDVRGGPPGFCLVPNCIAAVGDATFAFDAAQNAVGFLVGGLGFPTPSFSISVDGVGVGEVIDPSEGLTFVGLHDLATPFSTVSIIAPGLPSGAGFLIEDATFGPVAPVPVPAALPLLLAGLATLGLAGKRRPV